MLAKWITDATLSSCLFCKTSMKQDKSKSTVAYAIHFASTQHFQPKLFVLWYVPWCLDVNYDCSVGLIDCKNDKTRSLTLRWLNKNALPRFGEHCNCSACFACSIHAIWRPSFSQALYFELPMLPKPHKQHRQLNVGRWVFIYVPWCLDVIYDCSVGSIDQKNVVWFRPALVDHYLVVTLWLLC